jgi:hypothetical protein
MRDIWTGLRLLSGGGRWVATDVLPRTDATICLRADCAFRPERFSREKGIDYKSFVVRHFLIGTAEQWHASPAEDLFTKFRVPMDPILPGLDVVIAVRNVSARPRPFAVSVEGRVLR